ncbi:hypothetical protein XA68_11712 [Ophiocordyceps unilateralis]|uniref:Uncharacterized protein n=1 Tax=Ophiocordyceps unilateralis TaxID=268505 RepID=A0A2A9PG91_OPHUN|nr:hypothetical protein XA68_11712 [Ophiocordyceps unilateralis]
MLAAAATPSSRSKLGNLAHSCSRQSILALPGITTIASRQCRTFRCRSSSPRANKYWYTETFSRGPTSWDRDDVIRDVTTLFRARFFAANADRDLGHRLRRASCKEDKLDALYGILQKYRSISRTSASSLSTKQPNDESFIDPITNRRIAKRSSAADAQANPDGPNSKDIRQAEPQYELGTAAEQASGSYEDLRDYKDPVTWKEPDGLPDPPAEDLTKNYDDLDKYGPVKWHEPDGLPEPSAEDKSKKYKDLNQYKAPFVADDALLSVYEKRQQTVTRQAKPVPGKAPVSPDDQGKDYKDLGDYGPTYWHEPDGLMEPSAEDLSKKYEDLDQYNARYGSATQSNSEATSKQAGDAGSSARSSKESCTTHAAHAAAASKKCRSPPEHVAAGLGVSGEMKSIGPNKQAKSKYQDAYNKPGAETSIRTGLVRDSTTEVGAGKHHQDFALSGRNASGEVTESAADIRRGVVRRAREQEERKELQRAKAEHEQTWDVAWMEAQEALSQARQPKGDGLTGNYARDFPEEFAASWSTTNSWSKSTLYPRKAGDGEPAHAASMGQDEAEPSSMDESFPSESLGTGSKLEPALHRRRGRRQARTPMSSYLEREHFEMDPYSKEPQGLETNYAEECGGRLGRPVVKFHEVKRERRRIDWASMNGAAGKQRIASFKILAYDADTRSVTLAEMTCRAYETRLPSSPATVLPRLSNPSKFLPHFAALQAQGYEMASGGGDVVVFQRLIEGESSADEARQVKDGPAVNPIDLTGRPVTGNFASPTGFVNYEARPPYWEAGRTAEAKTTKEGGRRGKRRLGRKLLVTTAWVAGLAYAASVLGEFFSTGGFDGLGPQGL